MHRCSVLFLALATAFAGCAQQTNPSFPVSSADAKVAWSAMKESPKPLQRPVLVLGGIYDPGLAAASVERSLQQILCNADDEKIVHVGFLDTGSFDRAARKAIEAVDKRFASDDPECTVEVDVIGFSMGGLVARYAASDAYAAKAGRRLRVHRVFTVSSPHQGAKLAWVPMPDSRVSDMLTTTNWSRMHGWAMKWWASATPRRRDRRRGGCRNRFSATPRRTATRASLPTSAGACAMKSRSRARRPLRYPSDHCSLLRRLGDSSSFCRTTVARASRSASASMSALMCIFKCAG
jgi:hypothetical protein